MALSASATLVVATTSSGGNGSCNRSFADHFENPQPKYRNGSIAISANDISICQMNRI